VLICGHPAHDVCQARLLAWNIHEQYAAGVPTKQGSAQLQAFVTECNHVSMLFSSFQHDPVILMNRLTSPYQVRL